ncbi:MAG: glucuronate isomerase [Lachnospiraceae bacterium]|jgi:glucuronate isomerase|nr:glucuronate isomerase [Lachnospiraceae bacterium]
MNTFMNENFLLTTETAKRLYHQTAKQLPILDYHCHISPQEIAEDRHFENIAQLWLGGDHYKWRLLRANGTNEKYITGKAGKATDDQERFRAFARVMPKLIGNPMYHWSHLELRRAFNIEEILTPERADFIYEQCNEKLKESSARRLMEHFHVKAICTTDDPIDDLRWHKQLAEDDSFKIKVLPTFRPDKAINIEKPGFCQYIEQLSAVCGHKLTCAQEVAEALAERIDYFAACGCLGADHGLDYCMYVKPDLEAAEQAFTQAMQGKKPAPAQADAYKTYLTVYCAQKYAEKHWVMQLHFGCQRNVNSRQYALLGPDTGYDAVNPASGVQNLAPLLNEMAENQGLPKIIVYSLNPVDNTAIDSIIGCFQDGNKLQHGSAWWFNDHLDGMRAQLNSLAACGVLGDFVGMLTDSRSFLSYTRHEYFRRLLCSMIGEWVEIGQYPNDEKQLHKLVADICYHNANRYFGFEGEVGE